MEKTQLKSGKLYLIGSRTFVLPHLWSVLKNNIRNTSRIRTLDCGDIIVFLYQENPNYGVFLTENGEIGSLNFGTEFIPIE